MKSIAIFILIIFEVCIFHCQTPNQEYYFFAAKADSFYKIMNYKEAALTYDKAFATFNRKGLADDKYRAACAWALDNKADSAFIILEKITLRPCYLSKKNITSETSFKTLHSNKKWLSLIEAIKKTDSICHCQLRKFIDSLSNEERIRRNDYKNYPILRKIVTDYGFPDFDLVGNISSQYFAILVQHQDNYVSFQDSVLKLMELAYKKGKASGTSYAYLTDRVKCNKGELQIYGTQMNWEEKVCEPKPVIEPEKLNERRKSVGLSTEEEYIEFMMKRYNKKQKSLDD
jgi:hypothetical protein